MDIYNKYGTIGIRKVIKEFGNWEKALNECGIKLNGGSKHITDTDLYKDIEALWIKLGRQPTATDVKKGLATYSLNTFCRRFGSWTKALENFVEFVNGSYEENYSEQNTILKTKTEEAITHKTPRDINLRLRWLVLNRDNFKCCKCGRSPATNPNVILHVDHKKAYAKGGETVIDNLQTLCQDCNLGKSDLE